MMKISNFARPQGLVFSVLSTFILISSKKYLSKKKIEWHRFDVLKFLAMFKNRIQKFPNYKKQELLLKT